jgi:hypothetical protein
LSHPRAGALAFILTASQTLIAWRVARNNHGVIPGLGRTPEPGIQASERSVAAMSTYRSFHLD